MEQSFHIKAELWGKTSYWNSHKGLHSGKGKADGYDSYRSASEARGIIKKLQKVFDSNMKFSVITGDELPFIKKQKQERLRTFKAAARLVVRSQKASSYYIQHQLVLRPDESMTLIKRLLTRGIIGKPLKEKQYNWQDEYVLPREVLVKSMSELNKKLKTIVDV